MSNLTHSPLKGQRILIVDDDEGIREMLKTIFDQEGMYTHTADSAKVALEIYSELCAAGRKPEYVLVDAALSVRRTGFDVAEEITKKRDRQNYSTIIMLTAYAKNDLEAPALEGAIKTGIEEILHKPIDPDVLIADIVRIRERHLARKSGTPPTIPFPTNKLVMVFGAGLIALVLGLGAIGFHLQAVENAARRQQQEDFEHAVQNEITLIDAHIEQRTSDKFAELMLQMQKLSGIESTLQMEIQDTRDDLNAHGILNKTKGSVK